MTHAHARATEGKPMRRMSWRAVSLILVLGLAVWGCNGPNRGTNTQPSSASGFQINVTASTNTLRVAQPTSSGLNSNDTDGGCAIIIIKVYDTHGQLVDGAVVAVTSTLGRFKIPDDKVGGFLTTTRGTASVGFCAKGQPGTAIITASVEDAVASTLITLF